MAKQRHRSRKPLPEGVFEATIEALTHEGQGVARIAGKALFVAGALPGERVRFRYTACHSQYDEGETVELLVPSPERVTPRCAHFGVCGGCSLQHLAPAAQIRFKQDWLLENLARIGKVEPREVLAPLTALHWGYRRKARLAVKYVPKKGRVLVGFRERSTPFVADLARCEVLAPSVGTLLPALSRLIDELSIRERVPQIEVAVGEDSVALSFRVLTEPTADDLERLRAFGREHGIQVYLQPQGNDSTYLLWPERERLVYRLPRYALELAFKPYHFTQVNREINLQMIDRALELLALDGSERVLDLFCGLGNFTLALARHAAHVVGVEGDSGLVEWARRNAERNGIRNVEFHAADLAKDVASQSWMQQRYDKILLDPPRSGAFEMIPHVAALGARRVVYVSCHPATLARDAGELVYRHGYRLLKAGVMDMFPHTAHVESIALFERR
ncbi:MAG TPA: 23S rRNA (uracil(1939)-C(5))-methyltransferase RlmD [Candidatus Competibacteraceae bacterium]|nr:23S rRNA (uracil(1939)-C(5))-methyltransferase RlmD [Candidatus Competibacteraceae bacterium]